MSGTAIADTAVAAEPEHNGSVRMGGAACAVGGVVLGVGAVLTQIVQASTDVSDQLWRYPWSNSAFIVTGSIWAVAQATLVAGALALRGSGVAGTSRMARVGLPASILGTALIVVGHVASMPVRNDTIHDTGPQLVGGVFGIATALSTVGLLLAGWATVRAGVWRGWRRFVPLATGVWTAALLGLQFTKGTAHGRGRLLALLRCLGVCAGPDSGRQAQRGTAVNESIRLAGVSHRFGAAPALSGIDLELPPG